MKALAVLGPMFGIAASISTVYWNLYARRRYAGTVGSEKEPLFKKTLRYTITGVLAFTVVVLVLLFLFIAVASTLQNEF